MAGACLTRHLTSYLTLCDTHCLPMKPTTDTLGFHVIHVSQVKPASVHRACVTTWFQKYVTFDLFLAGCKKMGGHESGLSPRKICYICSTPTAIPLNMMALSIAFTAWRCLVRYNTYGLGRRQLGPQLSVLGSCL